MPPASWNGEKEGFELRVADSPGELEEMLRARAGRGASARMTAGYCWPWSEAAPGNPLVGDIVIGDWRQPWRAKGNRAVNGPVAALVPGQFAVVVAKPAAHDQWAFGNQPVVGQQRDVDPCAGTAARGGEHGVQGSGAVPDDGGPGDGLAAPIGAAGHRCHRRSTVA
ncbi:DNA/RNA helicase domain-containing protein [Amycolatopsis palatopharyngis]|uniref:DNA/RNA helicase domain-containing protein n=1 Tax=Amycolatopsis palatopharyngis TaxID=187982 RepID=UPI001FEBFBDB|nr:DNA/RNA helicase domain-containing protein [Amycolatopsis palatopharyngis]